MPHHPSCNTLPDMPTLDDPPSRPAILVVDDDPMLLVLLRTVLQNKGFQVWTASSGPAAVELYREHQGDIAVVLLDVCMPEMDGPNTMTALRQINPAIRATFMSGYTGRYSREELLALGAALFFEKPFQIHVLAEQLWQLASLETRRSA
jgi:two-component system cell cycle sensor histidine kinase/response regulator CckA